MFLGNNFGKTLDILQRSMDVNLLRQDVIANNIANSDTPNFKRTMVNFETSLQTALESEKARPFPTAMTDEKHMPFYRPMDYRDVRPRRVLDYLTTSKNNGNNVDIEEESMNYLSSQLAYTLMTNTVSTEFRNLNLVLRG
jgi:flagellar basal-body rod protein FlgB